MKISLELSHADLEHFQEVMVRARQAASELDTEEIVTRARKLFARVSGSPVSGFIRKRIDKLETLVEMVEDRGWGLDAQDRQRVVGALAYFSEEQDIIPDDVPGLGFLDDAIMIEMVARELQHEIQAYRDFVAYRAAEGNRPGGEGADLQRADWLEERRQQLHARMRRRRSRGGKRKSPFSLL